MSLYLKKNYKILRLYIGFFIFGNVVFYTDVYCKYSNFIFLFKKKKLSIFVT